MGRGSGEWNGAGTDLSWTAPANVWLSEVNHGYTRN